MSARHHVAATCAVAGRVLVQAHTTPALLLPPLLGPLVFFAIFGAGLSAVASAPGFAAGTDYGGFQLVFVLVQGVAFAGVFTGGLTLARDVESGFARRLLLALPRGELLLAAYVLAAIVRAGVTAVVLLAAALLAGVDLRLSPGGLAMLGAVLGATAAAAALWGAGIALRRQTVQAAPLMQMPIFLALFVAPVFVPLPLLEGWLHGVAALNPVTVLLEDGRALVTGAGAGDALAALAVAAAAAGLLGVWALRGLRRRATRRG